MASNNSNNTHRYIYAHAFALQSDILFITIVIRHIHTYVCVYVRALAINMCCRVCVCRARAYLMTRLILLVFALLHSIGDPCLAINMRKTYVDSIYVHMYACIYGGA